MFDLLRAVERFLRETGMSATRFGREAVRDPRLVPDLRQGRQNDHPSHRSPPLADGQAACRGGGQVTHLATDRGPGSVTLESPARLDPSWRPRGDTPNRPPDSTPAARRVQPPGAAGAPTG